ncbi:potassium voltage-gated channel protein Shaw-like [Haliotis rufescens]|uniref:potassium voltage-gated channel protein Shaw-like n=1 Tax=Haliotis rufescens TaxID=6454 RepID=UPI001EB05CE9|nr:potassium voltage-gated channel protein Shaw-like [Haliotis rufescens]XP_046364480.1 potassium voltage-gated channel protein Shaw-like [Haliotis rufescens]
MFKGREKDSEHVLHALMPGARINKGNKKITINVGTSNETITFNVGGSQFETYRSTLNRLPFSPLGDEDFLKKHYREDRKDYFFDREPDVFKAILNYLRTGELHLPAWLCGASIKNELAFWGVEEDEIEECCWTNYNSWTTTLEALRKLEKDRKGTLGHVGESNKRPTSQWKKFCQRGWTLMNNPRVSGWARVIGAVSMLFVILSIFSFCAETHESFHTYVSQNASFSNNNSSSVNVADSKDEGDGKLDVQIHPSLFFIDVVCTVYFLLEFITKFVFSPKKGSFFVLPMTIIDILALAPDIAETLYRLSTSNYYSRDTLAVLPVLRVTRIFRIFRLMRHIPGLYILFYTLKASLRELLLMLLFLFVGMLVYSSLIYFADDRSTFTSIPHGFWWALITMTTVGYGDMFPVTNLGYLVGSITAVSGLLMIGFTVPILVSNFVMYYHHTQSALERERKRVGRQKQLEAEAKRRRPSLFNLAIRSKFQTKDDVTGSRLASMADDAAKQLTKTLDKDCSAPYSTASSPREETDLLMKDSNGNSP